MNEMIGRKFHGLFSTAFYRLNKDEYLAFKDCFKDEVKLWPPLEKAISTLREQGVKKPYPQQVLTLYKQFDRPNLNRESIQGLPCPVCDQGWCRIVVGQHHRSIPVHPDKIKPYPKCTIELVPCTCSLGSMANNVLSEKYRYSDILRHFAASLHLELSEAWQVAEESEAMFHGVTPEKRVAGPEPKQGESIGQYFERVMK